MAALAHRAGRSQALRPLGLLANEDHAGEEAAEHGSMPIDLLELYIALEDEHGPPEPPRLAMRSLVADPNPFHSRAELGMRPPRAGYSGIDSEGLTAHHGGPSPWPRGQFDHSRCAAIWRAWQSFHMDDPDRRWNDIAYTSGVCPHGHRFEGRPAGKRTAANGTNEGNSRSEATVYVGGTGDAFTDAAKRGFLAEHRRLGSRIRWPHRYWTSTTCPDDVIAAWVAAGAPAPGGAPTPAPPTPPKEDELFSKSPIASVHIISAHSGLLLTAGDANGSAITQERANGSLNQRWQMVGHEDGTVSYVSRAGNRALDRPMNESKSGTRLQVWDALYNENQRWHPEQLPDGRWRLWVRGTNRCLDIHMGSKDAGAGLQIWAANGERWQSFDFAFTV